MADDKSTYTYPEASSTDDYSKNAVKGGTENLKSILTNKRVMTLLGIIALMMFFMFRKTGKTTVDTPRSAAPPVQKVEVLDIKPVIPQPAFVPTFSTPAPVQAPPVVSASNKAPNIVMLETKLADLTAEYEKMEQRQDILLQKIDDVADVLQKKVSADAEAKEKLVEKSKAKQVKNVKIEKHFSLQAIVYGRAWIKSDDRMCTIVVGDHIASYGTVVAIVADQGYVETSSGRNIVFEQSTK